MLNLWIYLKKLKISARNFEANGSIQKNYNRTNKGKNKNIPRVSILFSYRDISKRVTK